MQKKPKTVDPATELENAKKRIKKLTQERNEYRDWWSERLEEVWKYKKDAEEWKQMYYAVEVDRLKKQGEELLEIQKRSLDALNESTQNLKKTREWCRSRISSKLNSIINDHPGDGDSANLDLIKQFRIQPKN